jgi:gamma-glutamylputrescine oxidase
MDLLTANDRPGEYPASWYAATADLLPPFPRLEGDLRADVAIIGGGYTGLSAALHLSERGYSVVLLEAHRVGWGASGRNGGQVGSGQRQDQDWLEETFGRDRARALWDLGEEAKALVKDLIARHEIACDWRDGIAYVAHKPSDAAAYQRYAERIARDYGYPVEPLDAGRSADLLGTPVFFGGLLDPGAGHLHPLNFALGLARAAVTAGARIFERSRVTRIEGTAAETGEGRVKADYLILAANGYLGGLAPAVASRVMPINNFIMTTEPLAEPPIPSGIAVADSRFVVNYWRPTPDGRLLFGGGESYGYRFPAEVAAKVRRAFARIYPKLAEAPVSHAWGGTLAITTNRMPAFQRLGPATYSASGYSGHGVAMATFAGKLIAEAVSGTAGRFDLLADLPQQRFPGGDRLRWPLLVLAMTWFALRDRL